MVNVQTSLADKCWRLKVLAGQPSPRYVGKTAKHGLLSYVGASWGEYIALQ